MRTVTQSHTHTTVTLSGTNPNPEIPSIRSIVLSGLVNGTDRKVIASQIQELYPTSAGALKSVKHIAWYASRAKKVGTPEHKQVAKLIAARDAETAVEGNTDAVSGAEGEE